MNETEVILTKEKRDYSISFVRLIAMLFIVSCHILQFYDNELAWWFNVGVQMFFFISGYLYSNRKVNDTVSFLRKRFVKILVPYFICVICTCLVGFLFKTGCSLKQIAHLLTVSGADGFSSLAHLWFVPYILMCYLITPMVLKLKIIGGGTAKL